MKSLLNKYTEGIAAIIYIAGMPILMYLKGAGVLKNTQNITYCVPDVICNMEHYTKVFLCIFGMLVVMNLLKGYFRAGVILRYQSARKMYCSMLIRIIKLDVGMTIYQTLLAVLIGSVLVPFQCNWGMIEGAPYHITGNVVATAVSTIQIIAIYAYTTFFTILFSATLICTLWCITMTPVTGYIVMIILIVLESGVNIYARVFYSILDMKPVKMYLFGIFHLTNIILPVAYLIVFTVAGIIVLSKRDYMRVK